MPDGRDFLLSSDYPVDTIAFLTSGSMSVPNGTHDTITISTHGLPFMPLPMLVWSNTSDFTISNSYFDPAFSNTFYTGQVGQMYTAIAEPDIIYIQRDNSSGSTKTLYDRVYAFMPSDSPIDSRVPFTSNDGDPFIINSDLNLLKLAHAGKLTTVSPTYTHGLGYSPRVLKWGIIINGLATTVVAPFIVDSDPTGSLGITSGVYANATEVGWLNPNTFDEIEIRVYVDS